MKRMRPTSTQRCTYCKERANWKSSGLTINRFACDAHRSELQADEARLRDDGYMSEADHQTWGRI